MVAINYLQSLSCLMFYNPTTKQLMKYDICFHLEMSHRSAEFSKIANDAENDLRELL